MNYLVKVIGMLAMVLAVTFTTNKAVSNTNSPNETIDNLQKAIQEEGNDARKYIVYAEAAEREGYDQIADLFRAVSKSKAIQLSNHRKAIDELGGSANKIRYEKYERRSTLENLEELIEEDAMYPEFVETAEDENAGMAITSFTNSMIIECQQKSLLEDALESVRENRAGNYYVNVETGETLDVSSAYIPEESIEGETYVKID